MVGCSSIGRFRHFCLTSLCAFVLICSGCEGSRDVTNDPAFGNFSAVVGVWKSRCALWIMQRGNGEVDYLDPDNTLYQRSDKQIAALAVGTEIRIERLTYEATFETDYFNATGSLTNGPYAGKSLRLNPHLFAPKFFKCLAYGLQPNSSDTWAVDPDKLEK